MSRTRAPYPERSCHNCAKSSRVTGILCRDHTCRTSAGTYPHFVASEVRNEEVTDETEAVTRWAIETEKLLCDVLCKPWTPQVSILGLVEEIKSRMEHLHSENEKKADQIKSLESGHKMIHRRFQQLDACLDRINELAKKKST